MSSHLLRPVIVAAVMSAAFGFVSIVYAQSVEVRLAPPTIRVETRSAQPSPRHVWVPGYWQWDGNNYVWVNGKWDVPPRADVSWREPRWSRRGQGWVLEQGQWVPRSQVVVVTPSGQPVPTATPIEVESRPPPRKFERRVPSPGPGYVWIAGYWQWDGQQYAWVNGHWDVPQEEGATWVAPRWRRHGRRWAFEEGRWQARRRARHEELRERREDAREDRLERRDEWRERREDRREERREDRRDGDHGHDHGHDHR